MRSLLLKLWRDDRGALIPTEYLMVGALVVFGVTPGLVHLRDAVNDTFVQTGNAVRALAPAPSFSGYAATGPTGRVVAAVPGVSFAPPAGASAAAVRPLAGVHTPPAAYAPATLDPAP